jgi:hypothetical protein
VKCKFCGNILLLRSKAAARARAASPAFAHAAANGWNDPGLPESTPGLTNNPQVAVADQSPQHGSRGYKGPRDNAKAKWIAVGIALIAGAGIFAAVATNPQWFKDKQGEAVAKTDFVNDGAATGGGEAKGNAKGGGGFEGVRPLPVNQTGPMPRRLLAISVNEYLYANELDYGSTTGDKNTRKDFFTAISFLARGWRIPADQTYFLSDKPVAEGKRDEKHPPLKMVINGTVDSFLNTCRPQDRIVIIFSGHAVEKDGEAYLVPLEGELDDLPSLIPLKEFYDKLGKCVAQEKFVIFDVCRFDPGRGIEQPAFGMMTEGLEKALHNCPDGVTVWTSCSAGQYAYEYTYAEVSLSGIRDLYGSIFFATYFAADRQQVFAKRQSAEGLHHPADPLPIGPLTHFGNEKTATIVKILEKKAQTPKLTSKAKKEWLTYDPKESLAKKFEMAKPPPTAKRDEVAAMFREIELPGIKAVRKDDSSHSRLYDAFPFTEEQLKDYFNDGGPKFDEIAKSPAQFAKEYPLRAAAVNAILEMRKMRQNPSQELPEQFFEAALNDKLKKEFNVRYQRTIADRQQILDELKDAFDAAAKKRDTEKSKRWLANFDYANAQVRIRLAYIYEYNLALGKAKLGQLPELDKTKNQKGWKLASVEKMISPKEIRDLADEARTTFSEMVKENPYTPWNVLGKTQRHIALGLKWEASALGIGEDK